MINMKIFKILLRDILKVLVVVLVGRLFNDVINVVKEFSRKGVRIVVFGVGGYVDMR